MSLNKTIKTAISPTRAQNYPEWYQQIIKAADLAENSPVRGCMTIKPWGYAIWENMQTVLNEKFKETGHKNLYFPLLIPLSYLQKEADHIEGFAKECAVVTHQRLVKDENGQLVPGGKLEEPYIIRPTSETIIGEAFSRWIQSYRDLPLLINQWANVMRWEMRTRIFLRTSEFLWQEGHTAHASSEEALQEARKMLDVYTEFVQDYLAIPVIEGEKSAAERFPGAVHSFTIEAMMQDKKALQTGTSHFLGQHFARSFNIQYLSPEGKQEYVWTTSWGVSTRMIGALIMTHSDDDGLVLPPRIAPTHIVLLPIIHKPEDKEKILAYCEDLRKLLRDQRYHERRIDVEIDTREMSGGEKAWSWFKKGVPLRVEIGNKEVANNTVFVGRRDQAYQLRNSISRDDFVKNILNTLDDIQATLFKRAQDFLSAHTVVVHNKEDFYNFFGKDSGFVLAHFSQDPELEAQIKKDLNVTVRCLPHQYIGQVGRCIFSGEESPQMALFAKAY